MANDHDHHSDMKKFELDPGRLGDIVESAEEARSEALAASVRAAEKRNEYLRAKRHLAATVPLPASADSNDRAKHASDLAQRERDVAKSKASFDRASEHHQRLTSISGPRNALAEACREFARRSGVSID